MSEIDEVASELCRHLAIFQMEASQQVPAPILASQAGIIHRVSGRLMELLRANPRARVSIDTAIPEGLAKVYLDLLGMGTDVPDHLPEDWE